MVQNRGKVYDSLMDDFRIDPPLVVKDLPRPRRLNSLAEARVFAQEAMRLGRPSPWREVYHRLATVSSEEEADEAIGDLRELLDLEDLLIHPNLPPKLERRRKLSARFQATELLLPRKIRLRARHRISKGRKRVSTFRHRRLELRANRIARPI